MISGAPKASTDWSPYAPRNDRERPSNRLPPVSPSDCGMGYSFDSKQGRCVGEWCLNIVIHISHKNIKSNNCEFKHFIDFSQRVLRQKFIKTKKQGKLSLGSIFRITTIPH